MLNGHARACDALYAIPPDLPRDQWVKAGMAFHAVGGNFDTFDQWSSSGDSYNAQASNATWRSFKSVPGGVGAGALFGMARDHGWQDGSATPRPTAVATPKPTTPPRKPASGMSVIEVWDRCQPATSQHPYLVSKGAVGVPLDDLRVLPNDDPLRIMGESMGGALVVPVTRPDGTTSTLQLITAGATAQHLKAMGKTTKPNLPGCPVQGWHTVGQIAPLAPVYVCEGVGTAWAIWMATGAAAVVAFGWGNVGKVATALRQQDDSIRLVLCPDTDKEQDAHKIAAEIGAAVACMPDGWPANSDLNDLFQRDGVDVVALVLAAAVEPPKQEPRYKLLDGAELAALPALAWRVRGVLPAVGLAGLVGPSASGKSFLAFDLLAAIAEGQSWFGCRVEAAPVVYVALEGEAGFKLRAQAWEAHRGRAMPEAMRVMMQPFLLTTPQDVTDLATVVPPGAVVVIDTLNRAAPTADENSSGDMGEILQAAKRLQTLTGGLVLLVHHTGKDVKKGMRGHSSLLAAMDAVVEVSRSGDRREWKVGKAKDGADGDTHPFKLQVETLGTDSNGDAVTSCVVVADHAPQEIRAKLSGGSNQRLILEALQPLFKTGHTGKAGAPPLRPCIELDAALTVAMSRLISVAEKRKPERAKKAIQDLVAKGLMGFNEGWLWLT